jgi:hypothetical protein
MTTTEKGRDMRAVDGTPGRFIGGVINSPAVMAPTTVAGAGGKP